MSSCDTKVTSKQKALSFSARARVTYVIRFRALRFVQVHESDTLVIQIFYARAFCRSTNFSLSVAMCIRQTRCIFDVINLIMR